MRIVRACAVHSLSALVIMNVLIFNDIHTELTKAFQSVTKLKEIHVSAAISVIRMKLFLKELILEMLEKCH